MPFYDFRCNDCGERFEVQRPVDRRDEAACPTCGSASVQRLITGVTTLTGSGSCSTGSSGGMKGG
jgi:putative FmdB family regulatory protein